MGVADKTIGKIRYFTYFLTFPDGDQWVDQVPFVHDLQWELKHSCFEMEPFKKRDLLVKGETFWKDQNSVEHLVRIESVERVRNWGIGKPKLHKAVRRKR